LLKKREKKALSPHLDPATFEKVDETFEERTEKKRTLPRQGGACGEGSLTPNPQDSPQGRRAKRASGRTGPRSPEEGALRPEGWSGARLPLSQSPRRALCAWKAGLEPGFRCP